MKLLVISLLVVLTLTNNYTNAFDENNVNSQYVVSTTPVNGGSWNTTWEQPENHKYYKANYVNDACCDATIYIENKNGNIIKKKVDANSENSLYVKKAQSKTHTIWIENDDGTIALDGRLTVKSSSKNLTEK